VETLIHNLALGVEDAILRHGKGIIDRQFLQERMANAAIDIYLCTAVLSRTTWEIERLGGEDAAKAQIDSARGSSFRWAHRQCAPQHSRASQASGRRLKAIAEELAGVGRSRSGDLEVSSLDSAGAPPGIDRRDAHHSLGGLSRSGLRAALLSCSFPSRNRSAGDTRRPPRIGIGVRQSVCGPIGASRGHARRGAAATRRERIFTCGGRHCCGHTLTLTLTTPGSARFAALMAYWANGSRLQPIPSTRCALAGHSDRRRASTRVRSVPPRELWFAREHGRSFATDLLATDSASYTPAQLARARTLLGTAGLWRRESDRRAPGVRNRARSRYVESPMRAGSSPRSRLLAAAWIRLGSEFWNDDQPSNGTRPFDARGRMVSESSHATRDSRDVYSLRRWRDHREAHPPPKPT
jgi:hypothetical protein